MYRVLVCDDDIAILESIKIYLENDGYEVLTAVNGLEALKVIENNEIHCMVLDYLNKTALKENVLFGEI